MVEKSFNAIFAKNLRNFLKINGMTQKELAKRLSVGTSSVSSWCRGEKSPRMEKVDAMCKIFNCTRADLMEDSVNDKEYYLNDETRKIAQEVYEDENLRMLFDASRNATPEDIKIAADILRRMQKKPEED